MCGFRELCVVQATKPPLVFAILVHAVRSAQFVIVLTHTDGLLLLVKSGGTQANQYS